MPLKLNVRVGDSVAIGGPTTLKIEQKSGQAVGLVFDADRSVPIRIITDTPEREEPGARKPQSAPVGLGLSDPERLDFDSKSSPGSPGLGRRT